jgi:hypothetical protein
MLQCYVLTCVRSVTAFRRPLEVSARGNGPARPTQRPALALLTLDLGASRGWVVSTTPRPLYPRERPGTYYTGGWVGPRAGLDVCEK